MGSDDHYREEAPARDVRVDGLWVGRTTVTNVAYAAFVAATGYRTVAERPLDPADFPGAPAANLVAGFMVFVRAPGPVDLRHLSQWWVWTPGACWRHPEGPGSDLAGREDHPVVHVAYEDAEAYAAWAGLALPTEPQWERAARGGAEGATHAWGDDPETPDLPRANYWHGDFPWRAEDATAGPRRWAPSRRTAPASPTWRATSGNGPGTGTSSAAGPRCRPAACPVIRAAGSGSTVTTPRSHRCGFPRKVIKGGSFLCADSYCLRYRPAARRPQMIDTGMSHIGFRCVAPAADAPRSGATPRTELKRCAPRPRPAGRGCPPPPGASRPCGPCR
jgi:sulfatase modifying factor 1